MSHQQHCERSSLKFSWRVKIRSIQLLHKRKTFLFSFVNKTQFDQIDATIIQNAIIPDKLSTTSSPRSKIRMIDNETDASSLPSLLLTVTANNASYKCVLSCSFNGECRAEYTAHTTRHGGHTCRNFIVGKEATVHKRSAAAHWPRTPGSAIHTRAFSFTKLKLLSLLLLWLLTMETNGRILISKRKRNSK